MRSIGPRPCGYACACVDPVFTSQSYDISISTSTRGMSLSVFLVLIPCAYAYAYVDPVFTCLHMCLCLSLCLCASENQALKILNGRESAYSSSCYFFIVMMHRILNTIKYRIKWHMAQFPSKGGRLIKVKITKKDKHGTSTGWPRPWPPNTGNKYCVCMSEKSGLWKLAA